MLSSLGPSSLVILGGLAELFSGAISVGLGAYLASITDRERCEYEEARERREVDKQPLQEEKENTRSWRAMELAEPSRNRLSTSSE